nr:MAG TPA: hypothetical protein [Caudoviricetes sp.]
MFVILHRSEMQIQYQTHRQHTPYTTYSPLWTVGG